MKTLMQITLWSFLCIAAFTGCGSNNSSTASTTYGYVGGLCYNTSTNTQVATSYCSGTTYNTSMFSYNGTTCTSLTAGTPVNTAYCTSNPFTTNTSGCYDSLAGTYVSTAYCSTTTSTSTINGYTTQVCNGNYYAYNGYTAQLVACYGANCRGAMLYTVSTKTPVFCQ